MKRPHPAMLYSCSALHLWNCRASDSKGVHFGLFFAIFLHHLQHAVQHSCIFGPDLTESLFLLNRLQPACRTRGCGLYVAKQRTPKEGNFSSLCILSKSNNFPVPFIDRVICIISFLDFFRFTDRELCDVHLHSL